MRIIRAPKLSRTQSINSIAINSSGQYIGIAENHISIVEIESIINDISNNLPEYNQIDIKENLSVVNSIVFSNNKENFLISGGLDKMIVFHKIDFLDLTAKNIKQIPISSEINYIEISKNDDYFYVCCLNSNIYIGNCDFDNYKFTIYFNFDIHSSLVSTVKTDPNGSNKFLSFTENGRILLANMYKHSDGNIKVNILHDLKDYEDQQSIQLPPKKIE